MNYFLPNYFFINYFLAYDIRARHVLPQDSYDTTPGVSTDVSRDIV